MKKLIMMIVAVIGMCLLSITAYSSEFIPDSARTSPAYYFEPYTFEDNNSFEFYIEGLKLHYRFVFHENVREYVIACSPGTYHNTVVNDGSGEYIGEIDFSSDAIGEKTLYIYSTNTEGVTSYVTTMELGLNNQGELYRCWNLRYYSSARSFENLYRNMEEDVLDNYRWNYIKYLPEDTYNTFKSLAEEITAGLASDYDKAFAIYRWVASNIYYDHDALGAGTTHNDPVKTLEERRGVCGGYAMITQYLMQMADIPSMYVSGMEYNSGIPHAWNYIYIKGKWTFVDTTWGSTNTYAGGEYTKGEWTPMQFGITAMMLGNDRKCTVSLSSLYLVDDIWYSYTYDGHTGEPIYVVVDVEKTVKRDFIIRSQILGVPVTIIDNKAFNGVSAGEIFIPATVEDVFGKAFYNMSDFKVIFRGDDTDVALDAFYNCKNFELFASTESEVYNTKSAYWERVTPTNWFFEDMEYTSDKLTVTISNGCYNPQPVMMTAIYNYDGSLMDVMIVETSPDCKVYETDISAYSADNTVKVFLVSPHNMVTPYCQSVGRRLSFTYEASEILQSYHNYDNNTDDTQYYDYGKSCHSIDVTFSTSTNTEPDADYIIIYNGDGSEYGRYSGKALSGKTLNIRGNKFSVRLLTNEKNKNYYGYKTSKIVVNTEGNI